MADFNRKVKLKDGRTVKIFSCDPKLGTLHVYPGDEDFDIYVTNCAVIGVDDLTPEYKNKLLDEWRRRCDDEDSEY